MGYLDDMNIQARKKQIKLTKEQEKRILEVYTNAFRDKVNAFVNAKDGTATKIVQLAYTKQLYQELGSIYEEFGLKASETYTDLAKQLYGETYEDLRNTDLFKNVDKIASIVNKDAVNNIINGNIYKDGRGLDDRIWNATSKSGDKIQEAIASCMAQGMGAGDMAKVLKDFVKNGHTWDRKKIAEKLGDGYARKYSSGVSYEALRLARTTIAHASQNTVKNAHKINPYATGIKWHSRHISGRTCQECIDRDGQIFTNKTMPYDHPNGMCYMETVPMINGKEASISDVTDDLINWMDGKKNSGTMDKFNGVKPQKKEPPKKKIYRKFDSDSIRDLAQSSVVWSTKLDKQEVAAVKLYTGSGYLDMNRYLRGELSGTKYEKEINDLSKAIKKYKLEEDIQVIRGASIDMLSSIPGIDDLYEKVLMDEATGKEMQQALGGLVLQDKGFMSTSARATGNFNRDVQLKINVDKGTQYGAYVDAISTFRTEHEYLLDKNLQLKVINADVKDYQFVLECEILGYGE